MFRSLFNTKAQEQQREANNHVVVIPVFYICHLVGTKGPANNNTFKKYFKHWYQNLEISQLPLPYSKSAVSIGICSPKLLSTHIYGNITAACLLGTVHFLTRTENTKA